MKIDVAEFLDLVVRNFSFIHFDIVFFIGKQSIIFVRIFFSTFVKNSLGREKKCEKEVHLFVPSVHPLPCISLSLVLFVTVLLTNDVGKLRNHTSFHSSSWQSTGSNVCILDGRYYPRNHERTADNSVHISTV